MSLSQAALALGRAIPCHLQFTVRYILAHPTTCASRSEDLPQHFDVPSGDCDRGHGAFSLENRLHPSFNLDGCRRWRKSLSRKDVPLTLLREGNWTDCPYTRRHHDIVFARKGLLAGDSRRAPVYSLVKFLYLCHIPRASDS